MNDPAVSLRATRHDLSQVAKLLDHVLKEICDSAVRSDERKAQTDNYSRILAHRNTLRREEKRARQDLLKENMLDVGTLADLDDGELPDITLDSPDLNANDLATTRVTNRKIDGQNERLRNLTDMAGMRAIPPQAHCTTLNGRS